jgi:membrane-associated phospholipid phosphatase
VTVRTFRESGSGYPSGVTNTDAALPPLAGAGARPITTPLRPAEAPMFEAKPGSLTRRMGERLQALHPVLAGTIATLLGYAILLAATIAVGALFVEVLLGGWLSRADNGVNRWFADGRTHLETQLSWVGSHVAEAVTVIALGVIVTTILLVRRRIPAAVFVVVAILVEGLTYLGTTMVIDRHRPPVVRLDPYLGSGHSYPSGHVAAAVAIYGAIAIVVCAYVRSPAARRAAVVVAIVAPIAVAIARVYRGMHHPLDVIAGALMGSGCLLVALFVARTVAAALEHRHQEVRQ